MKCHTTSEIQILITDGFTVDLELVKHRCERLRCVIVDVLSPTCGRPVVTCSHVRTSEHICRWQQKYLKPPFPSPSQFLVYFIYFIILTVVYFVCAAVVIIRHCRSQPNEGGGTDAQAVPVELQPVAASSEGETLSNGKGAMA